MAAAAEGVIILFVRTIFVAASVACFSSCAAAPKLQIAETAHSEASRLDALAAAFVAEQEALEIPPPELSFIANLDNLGTAEALETQQKFFKDYGARLAAIDETRLRLCDRIDHGVMARMVRLGGVRTALGLRYRNEGVSAETPQRLYDVSLGEDWYRYYLEFWNGAALDPDEIFAFGETALAKSVAAYDALQADMGFEGDDAGLAAHLAASQRLGGGAATQDLFKQKQQIVWENLGRLFAEAYGVSHVSIAQSDRGPAFAVPGYYDFETKTFFYNLFEETYEARQADWLFLHEATPGHHFQLNAARRCDSRFPNQFFPAYSEGWAAYVETLGEELGLYQTPAEKLAAIEWDMVRSVRVALDVALNAYGWSDEEALAYWRRNVRGQEEIAQREIDRMKRWPAQVVTYKYGAAQFEKVKQIHLQDATKAADVKTFHDAALAYGAMPLSLFEQLFPALIGAE